MPRWWGTRASGVNVECGACRFLPKFRLARSPGEPPRPRKERVATLARTAPPRRDTNMNSTTSKHRPATSPRADFERLSELWDEHVHNEFQAKDTQAALETMTPDAYVNHVPVLTGGVGRA